MREVAPPSGATQEVLSPSEGGEDQQSGFDY